MKILYAVSEATPFVKTGGLGDVAGSLPRALAEQGEEVAVIMPYYESVAYEWTTKLRHRTTFDVGLAWRRQRCDVYELEKDGVTYYFIGNDYYFRRPSLYGFFDDGERFAFFSKAVLDILPHIGFPDVIQLNDWQTAMVAVYLKLIYSPDERYRAVKTNFTIHNIQYQGNVDADFLEFVAGISKSYFSNGVLKFDTGISMMKGAILLSDYITTVSPAYAREIQTPEHSHGLDAVLRSRSDRLDGILNGIDTETVNPETDKYLFRNYSLKTISDKKSNKSRLQSLLGLNDAPDTPIIALISRLADHKGLDLLFSVLDDIMSLDVQFVVLGKGEWGYEQGFYAAADRYRGRLSANIMFSSELASQIYAGADIQLVPSKSEPCGLTQMFAMHYGTVPVVRNVGGLSDTVIDYYADPQNGTGFSFNDYTPHALDDALRRALYKYTQKDEWKELIRRDMTHDFSWGESAKKYIEKYHFITGK